MGLGKRAKKEVSVAIQKRKQRVATAIASDVAIREASTAVNINPQDVHGTAWDVNTPKMGKEDIRADIERLKERERYEMEEKRKIRKGLSTPRYPYPRNK